MGGSETFIALASLAAISSVGVGGNMPVDSAVFLGAFVRSIARDVKHVKSRDRVS
jgi:hypothetical protein